MIPHKVYETLRMGLDDHRSDDLARAKAAWGSLTPEQMNEEYGESGMTRRQILEVYQRREDAVMEALCWLEAQR